MTKYRMTPSPTSDDSDETGNALKDVHCLFVTTSKRIYSCRLPMHFRLKTEEMSYVIDMN
ncbi:UNVERIFIED_CONTAM: hypothetical protein NCL1_45237 [Trichonephila clavipes]